MDRIAEPGDPKPKAASLARATPGGPKPPASNAGPKARQSWVPVRTLTPRHRHRIQAHLLGLAEHDRYLRFGFAATDAQIAQYVATLAFDRDELFGIFNRRLELIAMAHLAYAADQAGPTRPAMAEFGVSVSERARGRGLGARLFDHAILHARNRGIRTLFVQALSENTAMLRIARNAGATVVREGAESEACLDLPPDNLATQFGALVEDHAAEWDYQLKAQARRVHDVMSALGDARDGIATALRRGADG